MNKEDFPLFKKHPILVYLDSAATSQKPARVIEAVSEFYSNSYANIHRGIYSLSEEASIIYENVRAKVAQFINAQTQEIIFTTGATQSLNMVSRMLTDKLKPDDEIIISVMEHHSNFVCWRQIAKEKGAILKIIPLTADYHLDLVRLKKLINAKTKIVAITQMSNVLGTINPIKEICKIAHEVGAKVVVDAAQSAAHVSIDVRDLDCDFLAFSAHKIGGPTGVGVLYGKRELLENLEPISFGGGMVHNVTATQTTWKSSPYKFEAGTPPIAQAYGLAAGIDYLKDIGMEKIWEHTKELTFYALEQLNKITAIKIIGPEDNENRGPVISFTIDGIHPHDIAQVLSDNNICVRAGTHCTIPLMQELNLAGTTRISFFVYNTKEDVDKLVAGIKKVLKVFK